MEPRQSPLRVTFRNSKEYAREFDQNVRNGGIFIPTVEPRPLRALVDFVLVVPYNQQEIPGRGEVIFAIDPVEAAASGRSPGVGVEMIEFDLQAAAEARRVIQETLDEAALSSPEMRQAARFPARLQVRFRTRREFEDGMTRDISLGGMFLCTREPFPVGTALQVVLVRPLDGAEIVLEAEVARTPLVAQSEPLPIGMGIRFLPMEAARRAVVGRFVRYVDLKRRAQTAPEVRGAVREAGIEGVIHVLAHAVDQGELILRRGRESGSIVFKGAHVVRADLPERGLSGEKAFQRMLTWEDGEFEYRARTVEGAGWSRPSDDLVREGIRARREVSGWTRRLPPERRLAPGPALAAGGPAPLDARPLLDMLASRPTIAAVLDRLTRPDFEAYRLLYDLQARGVVRVE